MGRQAYIPQGDELVAILTKHRDLTYKAIHALYGWKGSWRSIPNAANRAGYRRNKARGGKGGGRLDVMPHDEFWAQVDQHLAEREAVLKARAERGNSRGLVTLRRSTLKQKYLQPAD